MFCSTTKEDKWLESSKLKSEPIQIGQAWHTPAEHIKLKRKGLCFHCRSSIHHAVHTQHIHSIQHGESHSTFFLFLQSGDLIFRHLFDARAAWKKNLMNNNLVQLGPCVNFIWTQYHSSLLKYLMLGFCHISVYWGTFILKPNLLHLLQYSHNNTTDNTCTTRKL